MYVYKCLYYNATYGQQNYRESCHHNQLIRCYQIQNILVVRFVIV